MPFWSVRSAHNCEPYTLSDVSGGVSVSGSVTAESSRRLEQSQYIFPFLRRFFAQRTKRVAKFIKLHNAAPLSYAYDSRTASPRQEIRF